MEKVDKQLMIGIAIGIVAGIVLLKVYDYFFPAEETKKQEDEKETTETLIARKIRAQKRNGNILSKRY